MAPDTFVIYCVIVIFVAWVCGFFMSRWLAVAIAGLVGYISGAQSWFQERDLRPQRREPEQY